LPHLNIRSLSKYSKAFDAGRKRHSVTPAAKHRPKRCYAGGDPEDEDRSHFVQLSFERDATRIIADGGILDEAYNLGPCGSNDSVLGGLIVLPKSKDAQIAARVQAWVTIGTRVGTR
jgi:hypothetical protein